MEEGVFIIFLISSVIGLIITYFIIRNAVLSALEIHSKKTESNQTDQLLTNILIQLGGNPNEFSNIEKPYATKLEESRKRLAKSNISNKKYEEEIRKLKNQIAEKMNIDKLEKLGKLN